MKMYPSSRIGISPVPILARKTGAQESKILGKHCSPQRENSIHLINVLNSCPTLSVRVTRRVGKTTCSAPMCDTNRVQNLGCVNSTDELKSQLFELVAKSVSSGGGQFALKDWRALKWPSPEIWRPFHLS